MCPEVLFFKRESILSMSGHSKWSTIKRKKEKTDQQRAKMFTKIGRELTVCVKSGGPDPSVNSKLKDIIAKAKANNVPNDNIDRIIKKAAGEGGNDNYEEIVYEGYGPGGIAVVVECLTDNRNRTAGDLRHYFDKCGGNLGQNGSVMFMFERKGVILIESDGVDEEQLMDDALFAGADDFNAEDGCFEITCAVSDFSSVSAALEEEGYEFASAELAYVPTTYSTTNDEEQVAKMEKLLEMLEDNDDVQAVWHNMESAE